jgi:hypothetical protein
MLHERGLAVDDDELRLVTDGRSGPEYVLDLAAVHSRT